MQPEPTPRSDRRMLLAIIGILVLALGITAAYFETTGAPSSQSSEVSSLQSVASSLSQASASQQGQIQSLQAALTSTSQARTVTITSTVAAGGTSTVTSTSTALQTRTVTSETTSVSTVTLVSTTVLPVGEPDGVMVTGTLTIPNGNGSGTLQLTVANTGNDPIVAVSVSIPTGNDPTTDVCTSPCTLNVLYNGNAISTSNPVPPQNNAVGMISTDEGTVGTTYTVMVSVSYADGTMPPSSSITLIATA